MNEVARKELPDDESGLLSLMFKSELFDNIVYEITILIIFVKKKFLHEKFPGRAARSVNQPTMAKFQVLRGTRFVEDAAGILVREQRFLHQVPINPRAEDNGRLYVVRDTRITNQGHTAVDSKGLVQEGSVHNKYFTTVHSSFPNPYNLVLA